MHSAGACVEPRIVAPRRLFDSLRSGRQLIPETIQVDAFAALDKPLNVRPAEIEVPQSRAADDFVPGPIPGSGASITTQRVTRAGNCAASAQPTMLPMSCVTRAAFSIFSLSITWAISRPCAFLSYPL